MELNNNSVSIELEYAIPSELNNEIYVSNNEESDSGNESDSNIEQSSSNSMLEQSNLEDETLESEPNSELGSEPNSELENEPNSELGNEEDIESLHEEVQILLSGAQENINDVFELFASNPEYYLNLINTYNKTKNGEEIYLPDLFNLRSYRNKGKLIIKFKLNDNDKWQEIGYNSNKYTDEDVYQSFSDKVISLISHPENNRKHLNYELENNNSIEQNSYYISKIDKYFGKKQEYSEYEKSIASAKLDPVSAKLDPVSEQTIPSAKLDPVSEQTIPASEQTMHAAYSTTKLDPVNDILGNAVTDYKYSISEQLKCYIKNNENSELLKSLGKIEMFDQGFNLLKLRLIIAGQRYTQLLPLKNMALSHEKKILEDYLNGGNIEVDQKVLIRLLQLDSKDVDLINSYDIKLVDLIE